MASADWRHWLSTITIVAAAWLCPPAFATSADPGGDVDSDGRASTERSGAQEARQGATGGPQSEPLRPATDDSEPSFREPTAVELEREPALRSRVQERWRHLISGDFDATYDFATPSYKESVDRREHAASYGDMVTWHMASIQGVRYDVDDQAEVAVGLTVSFPLGGEMMKAEVPISERWVYVDGEWYYTAAPNALPLLDPGRTKSK